MINLVKSSILNVQYEGKATFNVSSSSQSWLIQKQWILRKLTKVDFNNKDTDTYNILSHEVK